MASAKRTTHRSGKGKKLYAVRDAKGRFKGKSKKEAARQGGRVAPSDG